MKISIQTLALISLLLLVGCGTDYRVRSVINTEKPFANSWTENLPWCSTKRFAAPEAKLLFINPYTFNPAALNATDYEKKKRTVTYLTPKVVRQFPSDYLPVLLPTNSPSYYQMANNTNTPMPDRKYYRDELQNAILRIVKESTAQHLSDLKSVENNGNLLLGAATLGLAGGASVASGTAAQALAASAAGTAGARSLFNEQVYRQTFVESIIALIEKDQAEYLSVIHTRQTNSIIDYTVEAAILDTKEYEMRGSFYHGLALLRQAVQDQISGKNILIPVNEYTNLATKTLILLPAK